MSLRIKNLHRAFSALIVAALILSFPSLPVSAQAPRLSGGLSMPVPVLNFDGIGNSSNLESVIPPDVNGDVGPGHYVQVVNNLYGVWNKIGENLFPYGPHSITEPFTGFGGLCEFSPGNGAMVLYDHLADRWVITYPAYGVGQYLQCIAVTKTPDPVNGGWYRYSFLTSTNKINDHPKLALWPDGYYITYDELNPADQTWVGQGIAVFEREKMLQGEPANFFSLDLKSFFPTSDLHDMLFADLDGAPPPAGTPAYLAQIIDGSSGNDQLEVMQVIPNWNTGAPPAVGNAKFETVPDFDSNLCGSAACISQPGTSQKLDSLTGGLMNRLQYRYQGGNGYLITNQTVNVGSGQAGIRWYQFSTSDNSNWSVEDSGDFAPDSDNRWNGSAAMDASGNIAVGYSVSSGSTYPSIRYAGRLAGDTAGTLGQGEETLIDGGGSQTDASGAWGNYSSLTVDPVDQCTFWYTNEYYASTSAQNWLTRIGTFSYGIGDCTAPTTYDVSGMVTDSVSGDPIPNVSIETNNGYFTTTDNNGIYMIANVAAGLLTVTASADGYLSSSQDVTVPPDNFNVDFNLLTSTSDVNVSIGGNLMGNYSVPSGTYKLVSYPGTNGGPLFINSTNGVPIVSSIRLLYLNRYGVNTLSELMGVPTSQLLDDYWMPAYIDNSLTDSQIRFTNTSNTQATTVNVYIGGTLKGSYLLAPSSALRVNYPGVSGGPVRIQGTAGVPILAGMRVIYGGIVNGGANSFDELMAYPTAQLSNEYWFPFYNHNKVNLDTQLRVGNTSASQTSTVQIYIGEDLMGTYVLPPSTNKLITYPGVNGGPVHVVGTAGVPIVASLRLLYLNKFIYQTYSELMGVPTSQLLDDYAMPVYIDNSLTDSQIRFTNTSATLSTTVRVYLGPTLMGSYTLTPSSALRVSYTGMTGGPIRIVGTPGVPILAGMRIIYGGIVNGSANSFDEIMAYPTTNLNAQYWFPFYNHNMVNLDTETRFAAP